MYDVLQKVSLKILFTISKVGFSMYMTNGKKVAPMGLPFWIKPNARMHVKYLTSAFQTHSGTANLVTRVVITCASKLGYMAQRRR